MKLNLLNPKLQARVLINNVSANPSNTEIEDIIQVMSEFENLGISSAVLRERIDYRKADKEGLSVCKLAKPALKAINEIQLLYDEIFLLANIVIPNNIV